MALCPVCDTSSSTATCDKCGGAMTLGPGFTLERLLGAGGQSRVYAARPPEGGELVAIKILSLARVKDPKALELFRRSASVLVGLNHPGIAKLHAYFEEPRPHAMLYCMVQALIPGETLGKGPRYDESAAKDVALKVLDTLTYLHGLSPPVIHRDIKPSNLMRTPEGNIVLIDFDLVRDTLRPEGGSTLSIGTPGFTPMEQYMGEATPATDLYALGVTLAVLLARKEPTELWRGQRLAVQGHVNASKAFVRVLEKLTEPEPQRRYQRASDVIRALQQPVEQPTSGRGIPVSAVLGIAGVIGLAGLVALFVGERSAPAPAPTGMPATAPGDPLPRSEVPIVRAPTAAPSQPAVPVAPTRTVSSLRDPTALWAAISLTQWEGTWGESSARIAFAGQAKKKALLSGAPMSVELSKIGVITLTRTDKRGDTTREDRAFLRLSGDQQALFGTLQSRFATGSASYETRSDIDLRRLP